MRCSTPFGITEGGIERPVRVPGLRVLNAFRHHRGGHRRRGPRVPRHLVGAQRLSASQRGACGCDTPNHGSLSVLNAFRHHRGGHSIPVTGTCALEGAQRLSASQRGAWFAAPAGDVRARCLNAFRHHRGGHTGPSAGRQVVRRAQRLSASQRGALRSIAAHPARRQCSTPFGITEGGMLNDPRSQAGIRVLNAFRHHRGGHLPLAARLERHGKVLNAFRHHRGGHIRSTSRRIGARNSAQRLSASQRGA